MATDAMATPHIEQINRIERPARILLGWLTAKEAQHFLSGQGSRTLTAEQEAMANAARAAVNARPIGITQGEVVTDPPPDLAEHIKQLQQPAAPYLTQGWRVAIVDLTKVCALQQSIFTEHAVDRTAAVIPENILSIAEISLPIPSKTNLPVQFDQHRQAWIISAPNPNLRLVGHWSGEIQGAMGVGFGFMVSVLPSFLQVAYFQGRYVLRDGYHRAFGLLSRGITLVPGLVREFPKFEDLGLPQGLLPPSVYLGDRPPMLPDYLDESVSASVSLPGSQRMIIVHGMELDPLV